MPPHTIMKKASAQFRKVKNIPDGTSFIQLSYPLIKSPAWRSRSRNCVKLIEFLIIENIEHGGYENGFLKAPYNQLMAFGISKKYIPKAIAEAELKGLIIVERGQRINRTKSYMNTYTLTFQKSKVIGQDGVYYVEPSNDWKHFK